TRIRLITWVSITWVLVELGVHGSASRRGDGEVSHRPIGKHLYTPSSFKSATGMENESHDARFTTARTSCLPRLLYQLSGGQGAVDSADVSISKPPFH
ncbi:hypothetical protein BC826DRAFT_1034279, partial [Russula brevipes]